VTPSILRRDGEQRRSVALSAFVNSPSTDSMRPLRGAMIVVTRAASRAEQLIAPLEALGAQVLTYAATRVVTRDTAALLCATRALGRYDWAVFTSATSVTLTFEAATANGVTLADWSHTKIASVGSATSAALRECGLTVALEPETFVAEALVGAFAAGVDLAGARILYPTAVGARSVVSEGLSALGAMVDRIEAYESVASDDDVSAVRDALRLGLVHAVTLTASSAVDAWVTAMAPVHAAADAVSIGPVTTQAARAAGMRVVAEALPSTIDGLVDAVVRTIGMHRDGAFLTTETS
jgi:uroporphyrinogen-III synthase